LSERGVDERMRVIGSPGRKPVLKNVTRKEVEAFRTQVRIVDMIGCEDAGLVARKVKALARKMHMPCGAREYARVVKPPVPVERVEARRTAKVPLDKAGYFVILPVPAKGCLSVEHYANDNRLLRVIEGKDARSLYGTIIRNGWVSLLSHAAYLGKELQRAELSMKLGFKFIQDGI
jgi:tetrahydromethanopterin S-methyltransferase subunit A